MIELCRDETNSSLLSFVGEDGAETFFNCNYNEPYHSKIGPILEARHKFVEPSSIKTHLLNDKKIKILDLFFGLGYNTGIALDYAYKLCNSPQLEILAVEKDPQIIRKISELVVPGFYKRWQNILAALRKNYSIRFENVTIELYLEDIFLVIDKLNKSYFDVIFFDPFSHKATPEFWNDDFLTLVFKLLANQGTLTTYSSLKKVERLANNLGFVTRRVMPIGRKKSSLVVEKL